MDYLLYISICSLYLLHTAHCKQPNIVVIVADDLGWNDVSFHGSNEFMTPNIDALAYNGIVLNRHYVMPTCTPSRAAYLTGKYPIHTGMQGRPISAGEIRGIPLTEKLLPEYLKELGYFTHLVGKWHVGYYMESLYPTRRGFDSFFGFANGYLGYFDGLHVTKDHWAGMDAWRNTSEAWQEFVGHYLTDLLTDEAVNIIKRHNAEKPLYLQVAHAAPHTGNMGNDMEVRDIAENERMFPHIADTNRRLYAGMVRSIDDSVGNIIKALSECGLIDNSIILFTADNGAPSISWGITIGNTGSNWPLRGQKYSTHDGGVRSAAAVWSPFFQKGVVSSTLMHIIDWLPTFYEAAGGNATMLTALDGVSQLSTLKTQSASPRKDVLIGIQQNEDNYSLISGKWKIVKYYENAISTFPNYFYGSSGRDSSYPEYNFTEVQTSATGLALAGYGKLSAIQYAELRQQANIESLCSVVMLNQTSDVGMCNKSFCLFNIVDDPCEVNDLSDIRPDVLNVLLQKLKLFNTTVVPISNIYEPDPRAHPKYWHNYWVPWLDSVPDTLSSSSSDPSYLKSVNVYFLFIVILTNLFLVSKISDINFYNLILCLFSISDIA